jgi:hypothetical protein
MGGAALAAVLATAASAQSPSWPTPPTPTPQAESPTAPQTKPASPFSPARLGQMLAPIALYPDDLLADILMAATYPLDVVQAARWLQGPQNAALKGDQLLTALQQKSWDPSVKSLAPFPRILRMLDANLEWTEQLGEAYLADPAAVMDAVQRLRRRAQSAGRLVTTPQEIVRTEPEPTPLEETITIEAPSPEVVYVPICDPSFAYGPWPYPDYPPFFPVFAGAAISGCGWISGPIVAPFWGWSVLNFRTRHIEIDRKRLALFDRDRDRERNHDQALGEEWRHDPGHRGNVPYRDAAVSALFGSGTPAANSNPAFRSRWIGPSRVEGPVASPLPPKWQRPGLQSVRPSLDAGRPWPEGISAPLERGRSSTAGVQPRFGGVQPALEGVDPTIRPLVGVGAQPFGSRGPSGIGARPVSGPRFGGVQPALEGVDPTFRPLVGSGAQPFGGRGGSGAIGARPFSGPRFGGVQPALEGVDPTESGAPVGQSLNRDAETRMLIERGLFGRVPPTALAAPLGGSRASPSFGGIGSTQSLGGRGTFLPPVGIGAQPFGGRGPGGIGAQPFSGRGPQTPSGGMGAGGGRGGG